MSSNFGCILDILCPLSILLHNPLEDVEFCFCFKQAVPLVRFRLQVVSSLLWVVIPVSVLFPKPLLCFSDCPAHVPPRG